MGDNKAAANRAEIKKILASYLKLDEIEITDIKQVDPDATIFSLQADGSTYFLLEEDYASSIDDVVRRFADFGVINPQMQFVLDPPSAYDFRPAVGARPDYFTNDGDDYNWLRLYETSYKPKSLKYSLRYFLAKASAI